MTTRYIVDAANKSASAVKDFINPRSLLDPRMLPDCRFLQPVPSSAFVVGVGRTIHVGELSPVQVSHTYDREASPAPRSTWNEFQGRPSMSDIRGSALACTFSHADEQEAGLSYVAAKA